MNLTNDTEKIPMQVFYIQKFKKNTDH